MDMNNFKRYSVLILMVLLPICFYGQEKQDVVSIIEKTTNFYENTSVYSVAIKQSLFRGKTGTKVYESYSGSFVKNQGYSKLVMLNSEVIQFPGVSLIIDNDSKAIEYSKTPKGPAAPIDIKGFLEYYKGEELQSNEKQWICELNVLPAASFVPCDKIVLYINKEHHFVDKQVLFLNRELPFKTDGGQTEQDFGRFEIIFTHDLTVSNATKDKQSNYIRKKGNTIVPAEKYKEFKIVDLSNN